MSRKGIIFEKDDILYRYFSKRDFPRLSELIESSPEAMPLLFHQLDHQSRYRVLVLRLNYEKYIDRLKKFAISLSPKVLLSGGYDRTVIVAVDKASKRVIGAIFLSPLLYSWSIDIIVVDRDYRNKGIGTTLVKLAKEHAKRLGAYSIITTASSNSNQARFFRNRGFVLCYNLDEMECKL